MKAIKTALLYLSLIVGMTIGGVVITASGYTVHHYWTVLRPQHKMEELRKCYQWQAELSRRVPLTMDHCKS